MPATSPTSGASLDFLTGGLLEMSAEDRLVAELYASVIRLEQGLEQEASNLVALGRGERMPCPGVSIELLSEEAAQLRAHVEHLMRSVIWSVNGWYRLHDGICLRLLLAEKHLEIYRCEREMLLLRTPGHDLDGSRFVAAVFVRQPRSQPLKRAMKKSGSSGGKAGAAGKKTKAQQVYEMRLLRGAVTSFAPNVKSLRVSVTQLEPGRIKGQKGTPLAAELQGVEWHEDGRSCGVSVAFPDGTQVMPSLMNLELTGTVRLPLAHEQTGAPIELVATQVATCNALPIVVCTNENQWEQAEGRILRRQVFGDGESNSVRAPWPLLANYLNEFFMRATRQDLLDSALLSPETLAALPVPQRSLSERDLAYLQRVKLHGNEHVSAGEYSAFFDWYGPPCHQLRHNATVRGLFLQGLVFGLADQRDCHELLDGRDPGYFLIYLNETSKMGDYCLAFVHSNGRLLFHKIDAKKLRVPHGSLADFVRDKDELRMLVKPFHVLPSGVQLPQLVAVNKDEAFSDWYAPYKE
jgi:hypothetical protein